MKKIAATIIILLIIGGAAVGAQTMDKLWIVEENSGSVSTMTPVEKPAVSPGDVIHVLLSAEDLRAKWGEGYVTWHYSYRSGNGNTIWDSEKFSYKENVSGNNWDFTRVVDITIPSNIPEGDFQLGFVVVDYHTNKEYRGWTEFTVGESKDAAGYAAADDGNGPEPEAPAEAPPAPATNKYTVRIEDVELTLYKVEKDSNRLTFSFTGVNKGDQDIELRIYSYTARIIDGNGREYMFNDVDGGGKLSSGARFTPGIPMQADLYFRKPATNADEIALFYLEFYYKDDVLELRSIPVPWP